MGQRLSKTWKHRKGLGEQEERNQFDKLVLQHNELN